MRTLRHGRKPLPRVPQALVAALEAVQQPDVVAPRKSCNSLLHNLFVRPHLCERPHVLQVARGETLRFGEGGVEVGTEPVNHTRSPPLLRGQATAMHVRTMVADEEALPLQDGTDRMAEGVIKRLNDGGFGFIEIDGGGKDLFFHRNDLDGARFEDLRKGHRVSFTEGQGPKGPRAEKVKPI